ncbi:leucine-rich repeat domain-containing protein [Clostridium sp. AF46-9NS]|nr:leucine-rich repeat domain-containing protein [Clostridium sp. AF46-9NS]
MGSGIGTDSYRIDPDTSSCVGGRCGSICLRFSDRGSTLTKYRGTDERVTIPDTVEVVGESAFENNQKVQLVVVPKSVKRMDAYVFWGCDNLEEVVLGKGLTAVDEYAFAGCTGLKQITIPENVQSIEAQAFAGCTTLRIFIFRTR